MPGFLGEAHAVESSVHVGERAHVRHHLLLLLALSGLLVDLVDSCVHGLLSSRHFGSYLLDSLFVAIVFFCGFRLRHLGSHRFHHVSLLDFLVNSSHALVESCLHCLGLEFGLFDGLDVFSVGVNGGVLELFFLGFLLRCELSLNWRRRGRRQSRHCFLS